MKKKLLAVVLAVVMIAALVVPMMAISAADAPTATISLGDIRKTTRTGNDGVVYDVIAIDVNLSDNTEDQGFFTARYKVISEDGLECYFSDHDKPAKVDKGFDKGDYTDGTSSLNITVGQLSEGGKNWFQVVQDSTNAYGIYADAGRLITVYFKAPTAIGTYTFTLEWMDGTDDTPVQYDMTVANGTKTYTVECTEHEEGEAEVVEPAKCGVAGKKVVKCTVCNKVLKEEAIPALEHDWDNGVAAEGVACGSTADVTYTCKREGCGETDVETGAKVEHNWVEDEAAYVAPDCVTDGKKVYKCSNANCPEKTKEEAVAKLGHDLDDGTIAENVKCGDTANITYACSRCDYTKVETGAKVEHIIVADEANYKEATCTEDGVEAKKCDRAGCDYTETKVITKLGHDMVADEENSKAATCYAEGVEATKCSRCDYTETKAIAMFAHDFSGEKVIVTAPTAEAEGKYTIACVNEGCTEVEEGTIAKLASKVEYAVEDKVAVSFESDDAILPEDITIDIVADPVVGDDGRITEVWGFASDFVDLEGKAVFSVDTAIAGKFTDFVVTTKDANGNVVEVEFALENGVLSFEVDLTNEYTISYVEVKQSPATGDTSNTVVFAVVALIAVAGLVVVGKKRFAL